ncbi:hypothetical protein Back11_17810 [Paenibacillus baekrokdamisoli]|uniref:Uncharacterized protein n=1 Tax=Paenibacillus baekrokdamisoli TaxID=1712516 RepID=A0A3G9IPZ0_9BACL|nr:hypothetical protein Back11_17810 [Paenibacillus baekrokdamisoli]
MKELLLNRYPSWNIYLEPSGECIWVSVNDNHLNYFEIQVTNNDGVGITRRKVTIGIDFSGHDEAFKSLEETLNYLDRNIL